MPINTTAIRDLLRPGLAAVFGDYPMYPSQWTEIFDKYTSDKAVEIDVEIKLLGLAQLRAEGASTSYDTMGQRTITNYVNKYYGLGFIITRQAIKDNLYKSRFPLQATALKRSFLQTKEVIGANVLNNGFDSNFPIGDGKALFATDHVRDGGTWANTPSVQVNLNEASLEDALISIQQFKDNGGLRVMTKARKLIVPPQNQFVAERLLKSQYRVDTANNDVMGIVSGGYFPEGYCVNQFLTDTNAWFVKTDAPDGFKYYEREPMETDMYTDFDNDNLKVKAIERYVFGVSNARCTFGSSGAS